MSIIQYLPCPIANPRPCSESALEETFHITSATTGPTLTKLANEMQSAFSSLNSRKDVQSMFSVLSTKVPHSVLTSAETDGWPYVTSTKQPSWFTPLPGDVKSIYQGWQGVLRGVETSVLHITTNGAPQPTGVVAVGGMAAAGVMGVVAML